MTRQGLLMVLGGILAGFFLGWVCHTSPPPPAVKEKIVVQKEAEKDLHKEEGPSKTTTIDYQCPPPGEPKIKWLPGEKVPVEVPGPERVIRVTVTEKGPTTTDTKTVIQTKIEKELVIVPTKPPNWALGAGVQLLPDKRIEIAVEHRLFGPVWARAWALQELDVKAPAVGVGVRFEFDL